MTASPTLQLETSLEWEPRQRQWQREESGVKIARLPARSEHADTLICVLALEKYGAELGLHCLCLSDPGRWGSLSELVSSSLGGCEGDIT